jgi:D-glycero-D-manno-heptose 1,7-bisphosphate phosphatase
MDYQLNKKTIFLDRDGVINKEEDYLYKIEDFQFIEGVFEACYHFQTLGYNIIVVTNQSGIARGYYNKIDFGLLNNWMINQFKLNGIKILETFYCPHLPDSNCECRKPKPGMFLSAKKKYDINMINSWLIGDKEADVVAANMAGIINTVLLRSGHKISEKSSKAKFILDSIIDSKSIIIE